MRRPAHILLAAGLAVSFSIPSVAQTALNQLSAADKAAGWVSLFDGKTLDAWRGYKQEGTVGSRWTVAEGLLCVPGGNGVDTRGQRDIVTRTLYDQFELRWDWRVGVGGNSGLKYFVLEDQDSAIGHEYQMIDDERHPDALRGPTRQTAALYDVLAASNRPVRPAGEWNQSRVVVSGQNVQHWLNGAKVLDYQLGSQVLRDGIAKSKFSAVARFGTLQKAHVLLQDHGEAICYRNLAIKPAK